MLLVATTGLAANAALPPEQSARVMLPDGSRLELGGLVDGVSTAGAVMTSEPANEKPLDASMLHPRSGHTATVLPDGRVFIWGGVDDHGKIVRSGEWFDPSSRRFTEAHDIPLVPRVGHTATLLTDGRLLVLGGHAEKLGALEEAEIWDWRSNRSELLPISLSPAREGHRASLLADGRVLIVGPGATEAALYDPDHVRFIRAASEDASATSAVDVQVTGAIPAPDAKDVPLDALLALRFDPPLTPESANEKTIALIGPHGATPARVVAAESGRLVFVTPKQDLYPASHYTVFIQGVHDQQGQSLLWHALEFDTQRFMPSPLDPRLDLRKPASGADTSVSTDVAGTASAHTSDRSAGGKDASRGKPFQFSKPLVTDDEVWIPSEANLGGQWRTQRPIAADIKDAINLGMSKNSQKAAWRSHRLRSGVTEISGRILRLNDRPLAGVDVRVGEVHTTTDADGRFSFRGLAAGHQELVVDGSSVGKDGSSFAQFVVGVDVEAGKENPVKPIYLPKIRAQDWIEIPSPLPADLVVRNPYMPGFEVHLPAGTILRGRDGKVVRRVAVIPMPLDRTPINYPVNTPLHMTFQPGGMSVEGLTPGVTKGIQFVYPNYSGEAPGRRAGFLNYDPTAKGWYTYGSGSVSADGRSVLPDPDTQIYSATGFGIFFGAPPAPKGPRCDGASDGDPVDLRTGLFKHSTQGPAMDDVVPLSWRTTYRPGDTQKRNFGYGTSHTYGMYLYYPGPDVHTNWMELDLVLPDCSVVKFESVMDTPHSTTYLAKHTSTPTAYYGATLTWDPSAGVRLTRRDGTQFHFNEYGGDLLRVVDRFGRSVEVTRSGGLISRVATESGRYVDVQYDTQNRITDLADIAGRHWQYAYTSAGYLDHVTYPDTTHENFIYDANGRMTDVFDRRGNRMVHNVYDSSDRVTDQTLADGALYHFDYVANAQGLSTQVDVTRPNGTVRRVTFHASGYPLTDTDAFGTSLQRTVTYERDSIGFVTAFTDALNRRTELGYDSDKHVTSLTTLAGTTDALTGNFTYTPAHDLATMVDPWGRTTTFTFDARRHLKRIEDSFGRSVALTYDDLDRVTQLKDHLNRTTSLGYDLYDVRTVTDPLLNSTTYFVDTLGRPAAVENPLHQRTQAHYDINDRVKDVVDASGATTAFGYDAMGNLTSLTDALNRTTNWTYDARQRPLTRTDAL
ncbi:YD repeat-containing protein, partial [Dokdonella fugitiva]